MPGRRRTAPVAFAAALLAVLTPAGLPPAADAAGRAVPRGFFGVMADGPVTDGTVPAEPQLRRMHAAGAETVRVVFDWSHLEPQPGTFDLTEADRFTGAAADAGLAVLPVLMHAPPWALAWGEPAYASSPSSPQAYADFAAALVRRYGHGGSFWAGRDVKRPIRAWQVWNEPNLTIFWTAQPWATTYVALLAAAHAAIKAADPRASVVVAGLTNGATVPAWVALKDLYAAGARGQFDVLALHPYTGTVPNVLRTVRNARRVMRANHDLRPVMVTETSFSSSAGATADRGITWDRDEAGQARAAAGVLRALAAARRRLGIRAVTWYTWLSPEVGSGAPWYDWTGLNRMHDGAVVAKPALAAYRRVALRAEGRGRVGAVTRRTP